MKSDKSIAKSFVTLLITVLFSGLGFAQSSETISVSNNVSGAIKAGSASQLAKYFNSTLDLEIPDNDGSFSTAQAEQIMREFFKKYPPKSYSIKQTGASNDGSSFYIGVYTSSNNTTFRTYYLMKSVSGKSTIQLLQFEKE